VFSLGLSLDDRPNPLTQPVLRRTRETPSRPFSGPSDSTCDDGSVSDDDMNNEGFEAGLRWIAQQVSRSAEHLEDFDIDQIARAAGLDVDRAKEFLDGAGEWLNTQAESLVGEAGRRFGALDGDAHVQPRGAGPHPLDAPTPAQGLALSALDSGRWTVEPGSHVLMAHGNGPAPADALGLVGELRARDWINAQGDVTLVGRNALRRWIERADAA
jgi:hypothetical protein